MPAPPTHSLRRPLLGIGLLILALAGAACGKQPLRGYEDRADAFRSASRALPAVNATAGEGYVNVVCRAGDSTGRAPYDTLFGCLLRARETGAGVLILPRGVYLGHVSELMTRTLKYYRMEEQFERYLGYRLVLRFRRVHSEEQKAMDHAESVDLATQGASQAAAFVVGLGYVPLTPVVFLVESGLAERERQKVADDARAWGLPEPDRGAMEVTWVDYKRRYAKLWERVAGPDGDKTPDAYVVEECYLERPGRGEVLEVVRRRPVPPRQSP